MAYGFVYFLTNPSMPDLVKIGFTYKHPLARMEELTKATACPTPFEMLAFFDTEFPREVERDIHEYLHEYRTNPAREFFSLPLIELQGVARQWCNANGGIYNFDRLDYLANEEGQAEADALHSALMEVRNGTRP